MTLMRTIINVLAAASLVCVLNVQAAEEHNHGTGIVHLSATAEKEVKNDLLVATLVVSEEDKDPAQLANKVNAKMGWALARLKPMIVVKHRTLNYRTNPVYDRKGDKVTGWRAQQSLEIESDDFKAAGKAIEVLQERLKITSMRLSPKTATRKAAEDQLINEALNAFKARAELVQSNFGLAAYELVEIHVNTHANSQQPMRVRGESMEYSSDMSAPGIQGGTSNVIVQVQGSIRLN